MRHREKRGYDKVMIKWDTFVFLIGKQNVFFRTHLTLNILVFPVYLYTE